MIKRKTWDVHVVFRLVDDALASWQLFICLQPQKKLSFYLHFIGMCDDDGAAAAEDNKKVVREKHILRKMPEIPSHNATNVDESHTWRDLRMRRAAGAHLFHFLLVLSSPCFCCQSDPSKAIRLSVKLLLDDDCLCLNSQRTLSCHNDKWSRKWEKESANNTRNYFIIYLPKEFENIFQQQNG